MNRDKKKWLYLPAEIKVREVPAKILLAAVAASRGYKVVFARKLDLARYIDSFPPGIFLGFGAHKNFEPEYKKLKQRGFKVFVMDEEALATFSDDIYLRLRVSLQTLNQVEAVLAWGVHHSQVVASMNNTKFLPIYPTGNVRFDILRPEFHTLLQKETEDIKERFGRFILVNSSFGAVNHFDGKEKYFEDLKKKKVIQNEKDAIFYRKYFELKQNIFDAYCDAIPALAQGFPDHKIIIRPHPSERYEAWADAAKDHQNVEVIHEGSIHPWLLASDAVIHHFCTTALEAFMAGVPTIGYRPFKDDNIETPLVYKASLIAEKQDELINHLQNIIHGNLEELNDIRHREHGLLQHYIENAEGTFAFENYIEAFDKHAVSHINDISFGRLYARKVKMILGETYRFMKRGFKFEKTTYTDHKFSSLSKNELENMILDIGRMVSLKPLHVKQIEKFCYLISSS
nr:hypothetical protein [Cytophagales bacterium]